MSNPSLKNEFTAFLAGKRKDLLPENRADVVSFFSSVEVESTTVNAEHEDEHDSEGSYKRVERRV